MSKQKNTKPVPDFKEIVESLNDMIYELDDEGRFYYANHTLEKLSGYSKKELKKIHYWDLIKEKQVKTVRDFYQNQIVKEIKDTYYEFILLSKEGKEIWVGQNVRMTFNKYGVTTVRAVARDITNLRKLRLESERKAKELEQVNERQKSIQKDLEEKNKLTDLILNTMTDAVAVISTTNEFLLFNDSAKAIAGKGPETLNPTEWSQHYGLYYPDQKTLIPTEELPMVHSLNGREVHNFEAYIKNESNVGGYIKINSRPLRDDQDKVIACLIVTSNINEQKEADGKLRTSEEKFRAMSDASPLGIFVTDQAGACEYTNAEYQKLSGLTFEEALGAGWASAIHEEDVDRVFKEWHEAVSNNTVFQTEQRFRRKDGTIVWTHVKASAMVLQGKTIGHVGSIEDITKRKEYERELLLAKEEAEKASRAKEDFLSTMSHEIRTPLNAVIGMTHLLQGEEFLPHQEDNLNTLRFSADNLLVLINDILDYNKIESGKVVFEKVEVDLKKLVTRIRQTFALKAQEKEIRFNAIFDSDIPHSVLTDPVRLNQIITNLIANAIKFTHDGFVKIEVMLEEETDDRAQISFSVKDSGIGIPANDVDKIFDRFMQADKTTTRQFGGTGLGLAITKRLIDLQGGNIGVESEPGKGSNFHFTLEFEKGISSGPIEDDAEQVSFPSSLAGTHVLIVEDNLINQVVATKFLKKWNVTVDTAENGQVAIDKLRDKAFDLILMDLQMPVMDGYEATKAIKKDSKTASIPIIALTASALTEERDRVFKAGMEDYITKPLNPQELYSKIAKTIDREAVRLQDQPSQKSSEGKLISTTKVEMIAEGDIDFLLKMYESYISELDKLVEVYSEIVKNLDEQLYRATKHKLSASIDLFDAHLLGDEMLKTEYLLLNKETNKLNNNRKNINRLVEAITSILNKKIESLG